MKYRLLMKLVLLLMVLQSCSFEDSEMVYEEKLVVFASISADLPVIDTVLVSKTAGIEENVVANDLFINDAQVSLIEDSSGNTLDFSNVGPGKYFPISEGSTLEELEYYANFIIAPG